MVRGRKIGFVFQSYQLIPTLTAEENVLLPHELLGGDAASGTVAGARTAGKRGPGRSHGSLSHSAFGRRAAARGSGAGVHGEAADSDGGRADRQSGQRQRAAGAGLAADLNRRERTTLVLVTHDQALAARADRIVTLTDGQIVADEIREPAREQITQS